MQLMERERLTRILNASILKNGFPTNSSKPKNRHSHIWFAWWKTAISKM